MGTAPLPCAHCRCLLLTSPSSFLLLICAGLPLLVSSGFSTTITTLVSHFT